jgi:hypothetical protein
MAAAVVGPALFAWGVLDLFQLPVATGVFFACKESKGLNDPSKPVKDQRCFQQQAFGSLLDMGRVYPGQSAVVVILSSIAVTIAASIVAVTIFAAWRWANTPRTPRTTETTERLVADNPGRPEALTRCAVSSTLRAALALSLVLMPWAFLAAAFQHVAWVARPVNMTRAAGKGQAKPVLYDTATQASLLPDVLLVMVDDMNMDWLDVPSAANFTPNFHAFARRPGTTNFAEAHAHVPKCAPSRVSLLTGLSVGDSGLREDGSVSAWRYTLPDSPSLPEHLMQWYGYETYGSGKIFHDGRPIAFQSSEWTAYWPSMDQQTPEAQNASCYVGGVAWGAVLDSKLGGGVWNCSGASHPDGLVAAWAAAQLKATENTTSPLFIAVGLKHPHLPWFPDAVALAAVQACDVPFLRTSDAQPILADLPYGICNVGHFVEESIEEMGGSEGLERMVEFYSATTSFSDRHFGTILAAADLVDKAHALGPV